MGCLAEVLASDVGVNFEYKKEKQKYLIEHILKNGLYDLKALAEILGVSPYLLSQVLRGVNYLEDAIALKLIDWFFIFIGDYE